VGWALALLTLWTLGVRMLGIDFGVPCMKEADTFIVDHVRMLREGEVKFDRALSACQYPSFLADITAPLSARTGLPTDAEHTLREHLDAAARPWVDVRRMVAWLSILIVPGTFLLARRFVSAAWALFAAALVSFSLLHVFFAQEARAHGVVIAFSVLAVVCALWLRREPGWRAYIATAITAALSIACLHNGLAVLAPIAVAQLLRRDRRWWDPRLLLVFALGAAAFRVFYWYYFDSDAKQAMAGEDALTGLYDNLPFDGSGFARMGRTLWFYEPLLLVLVALAAACWSTNWRRARATEAIAERGDLLVVLAYVVPYVVMVGFYNQTYERFMLLLLPYLATFAAWGASALSRRFTTANARRAFVATCIAALALPAFASTKMAWLRSRPSTVDETGAWIGEHVKDPEHESLLVLPPLDFPVFRTVESLRYPPGKGGMFTPWSKYQNKLDDARRVAPLYRMYWLAGKPEFPQLDSAERVDAYLRSYGPGLFICYPIDDNQSLERRMIVDGLRRNGKLLARISPDANPRLTDRQLWDQDVEAAGWPHVTWRVLRARAVGPIIEIYRLD
jgi:hypothetical protein